MNLRPSLTQLKILPILFLALLLCFPSLSVRGAADGLILWFNVVLPTLSPFLIGTRLIAACDGIRLLTGPFYPVLHAVFGVSVNGAYVLLCGLLCGYPLGAGLCADFLNRGLITKQEAEYLLAICNHPSPMFLLGFVRPKLPAPMPVWKLLLSMYLPLLPISRIAGRRCRFFREMGDGCGKGAGASAAAQQSWDSPALDQAASAPGQAASMQNHAVSTTDHAASTDHAVSKLNQATSTPNQALSKLNQTAAAPNQALSKLNQTAAAPSQAASPTNQTTSPQFSLDAILLSSAETMVVIGGYIMLFSILAAWIGTLSFLPEMVRALLSGIFEITTGVHRLCKAFPGDTAFAPVMMSVAFGGVSGMFQTRSVLSGNGITGSEIPESEVPESEIPENEVSGRGIPGSSISGNAKKTGLSIRSIIVWKILHAFLSGTVAVLLLLLSR